MVETNPKLPRRGRPSSARASQIDRALLDCAYSRFLSEGFDGVAMEQVAADAGVSKGTLYARHASKEALFTAVIEAKINEWSNEASVEDHLLTDDIMQRLHHHAGTVAKWVCRPDVTAFNRTVTQAQPRFPELARKLFDTGYMYIVGLIAREIEEASVRDGLPVRDAVIVAKVLVSSISGFHGQEELSGQLAESDVHKYAHFLVDLLVASRSSW